MRRVRTPEGSRYFDAPIGTPITAALLDRARDRNKGKPAPKGATSQSRATPKVPERPKMPAASKVPDVKTKQPQLGPLQKVRAKTAVSSAAKKKPTFKSTPSISGPEMVRVGTAEFGAPAGSRVFRSKKTDKVGYVVTPDGNVHVFSEAGEVELDSTDQARIAGEMTRQSSRFDEVKGKQAPLEEEETPSAEEFAARREQADAAVPPTAEMRAMEDEEFEALMESIPDGATVFYDVPWGTQEITKSNGTWVTADGFEIPASQLAEIKGGIKKSADDKIETPSQPDASTAKPKRDPKSLGTQPEMADDEIEALRLSPYSSPHLNPDGTFTEERQKLHEQIIEDFLAGLESQENPIQYMNGGGPASGKGTMTKGKNAELTNYPSARKVDDITGELEPLDEAKKPGALLIDPDAVKMQFPETKEALKKISSGDFTEEEMKWAAYSHEESSQLAKRLHSAALERGVNVIYDGTGNSSPSSVKKKVKAARDAGYRVEANYLYLDPEEGIARAQTRAERSNRVVPPSVIRKTYEVLPPLFDALKDDGTFDSVNLFDNNVPFGQPANLIGRGDGKTFEILDEAAYSRYLNKENKKDDTSSEAKAAATGGVGSAKAARDANK